MEKIKVTSATTGESIDGTLVTPVQSNGKAVLFIHGWRSSESGYIRRAKALADIGYTCFAFSLRGHGNSSGDIRNLTRQDFINDVTEAYDFLAKQNGVNPDKIGIVGASFGGYLAALLTKRRPVRWLALRAPANYPDNGFESIPQNKYPYESTSTESWRKHQLDHNATVALRAIHQYPHEILIVESGNDSIVPHQAVQNYVDAVNDATKLKYTVMHEADHPLSKERYQQEFIDILVDWFNERN